MPKLVIDNREVPFSEGDTLLTAARAAGISIPTLCHHADLSPVGSCRLCLVECDGLDHFVPACTAPAAAGMQVRTESIPLTAARRMVLALLAERFAAAPAPHEPANLALAAAPPPHSEFQYWAAKYGVPLSPEKQRLAPAAIECDPGPFLHVDLDKCILCTRCIRACNEIQGRFVWRLAGRGHAEQLVAGCNTTLAEARCESCGACAAYCPTGAIADKLSLAGPPATRRVTTTCSYCGVGCQFDLNVAGERVIQVTSQPAAPVNGMALCVKGRYGYDYIHHAERLARPQVREHVLAGRCRAPHEPRGAWIETDWPTALRLAAERLAEVVRTTGPEGCGFLASAKCTNEENYLVQKLARQVVGTHNVDHCARLCHSSTVAGLAMCFGSGAMSNSLRDLAEHSQSMLLIGSNVTEQHPVFGAMIRQAVLRRGLKLVVADPRRIEITEFAALHLRQRPGTDVALLNGLMQLIVANGWHDEDFIARRCEHFPDFLASLSRYPPARVAEITGVPEAQLAAAAELLARQKPMAAVWAMGITQHTTGVLNVLALGNLQMLLGNMGVPGGGVNPLRGQNNVQGACDMGALPNVFPGYQAVTAESNLAKFAAAWQTEKAARITGPRWQPRAGLTVTEMVRAAGEGSLRALFILGEDPALTEPDLNHVRQSLARAEFVVLQEIFPSATAEFADVLLPGASFAEKEGTFTNTERRVQRVRAAVPAPGSARPDWQILAEFAQHLLRAQGCEPRGPEAGWNYTQPGEILDEIGRLTPSYAGVNYGRLERGESLQWPVPSPEHSGTPILHVKEFTRGLGRFHVVDHLEPKELPDPEFPLLLTTGRVLYHWHGGELTRRARGLLAACPAPQIEIHPDDAAAHHIAPGDEVELVSRRGTMRGTACLTERVAAGVVFGNFHFPGPQNVNNLTLCELDPIAKIPEYKVCAVRLQRPGQ